MADPEGVPCVPWNCPLCLHSINHLLASIFLMLNAKHLSNCSGVTVRTLETSSPVARSVQLFRIPHMLRLPITYLYCALVGVCSRSEIKGCESVCGASTKCGAQVLWLNFCSRS